MDFEKLKKWMEVTQQHQNGKFWEMVFDEHPPEELSPDEDEDITRENTSLIKYPQTDIYLTDQEVILLMEIPGAKREDIFLSVSGNKLTVRGVIHSPAVNGVTVQNERLYGEFNRDIDLPEPTKSKHVMARFQNGLLIVSYPRTFTREENIIIR